MSRQQPAVPTHADLADRDHIDRLLAAFYTEALADALLGPVFATAGMDLETHLPRIGDFWERSLLGSGTYRGQPMALHRQLNRVVALTPAMFDRWLALWAAAVDASFSGPVATLAKTLAAQVAAALQAQLNDHGGLPMVSVPDPGNRPMEDPR